MSLQPEIEKASTDKTTVMRELAHALGSCTPAYENAANTNPLMENIAHTNLHYGNMVTYLRLLGLAPPSS